MTKLTARSSTIFIATGKKTKVYHSLAEVPPSLRRKLDDSTKGTHSATILIADRRGREELVRALRSGGPAVSGQATAPQEGSLGTVSLALAQTPAKRRFSLRTALEVAFPIALGVFVWIYIATRF